MYGRNKVIRRKIIFLSGSAKFSFAYLRFPHLHIHTLQQVGYLGLTVGLCASEKFGIRYLISWVLGIG